MMLPDEFSKSPALGAEGGAHVTGHGICLPAKQIQPRAVSRSGLHVSVATGSVTKFTVAGSLNCYPQILMCELGGASRSMYLWEMGHPKTVRWAGVGGAGAQDSEGHGRAPLILPLLPHPQASLLQAFCLT